MNTLNAKKKSAEPALRSALNKRTREHEKDDATTYSPQSNEFTPVEGLEGPLS